MNVLMIPQLHASKDLFGISVVNFMVSVARMVNVVRSDITWTLAVPSSDKYHHWDESKLPERMTTLPILPKHGSMIGGGENDGFAGEHHAIYSAEAFKFFASEEYLKFDVVYDRFCHCCFLPTFQAYGRRIGFRLDPEPVEPTVISMCSETATCGVMTKLKYRVGDMMMAFGAAAAKFNVVLIDEDYAELQKLGQRWLSPSERKRLRESMRKAVPAVDVEDVPEYERPKDRAVFFHGGSFSSKRHLPDIVKIVEKVGAVCPDTRFILATQTPRTRLKSSGAWWDRPNVEVRPECGREEYFESLKDGDFVVCYVDWETTGLSYIEAVVSGMTPIFVARKWNEDWCPEGYPFRVKDAELERAMLFCARHPAKAKKIGQQAIEFCREKYDRLRQGRWWSDLLDEALEDRIRRCGSYMFDDVFKEVLAGLGDEFSDKEFLEAVQEKSRKFTPAFFKRNWHRIRVHLMRHGALSLPEGRWRKCT
jgi:glycosyltransferase involved in cell wall biosynthesis